MSFDSDAAAFSPRCVKKMKMTINGSSHSNFMGTPVSCPPTFVV